jgi:purine-binding chemotaxis protein CheW
MGEGAKDLRLITFRIGPETFVVDIMAVRQIIPYTGSTSVPAAPSFIEGVVVVRNSVIPVVDLRQRLYPAAANRERYPLLLITHTRAGTIGMKVDEVRRIVNVSPAALLPPPPLVRGIRGDLLIAVIPHGQEVFLLIDLERVLSVDEQQQLHSARLSSSSSNVPAGGPSDR